MASRARLDFALGGAWRTADHVSARTIDLPAHCAALVERNQQPMIRFVPAPVSSLRRPRHVIRARTVACLAGDVDLGIRGGKGARGEMIVLAQVGRMAICAHE